jgi:hypothetical protein
MEDRMDHLMLLGGQFLQARGWNEYGEGCRSAAERGRKFWDNIDQVERGIFDAYGFAARLVAGTVLIGMVFGILSIAAPSASETRSTACFECAAAPE